MGRKAKDLTEKRFGKLIVKSRAEDTYNINGVISGKQKSAYGYWWEREDSNE